MRFLWLIALLGLVSTPLSAARANGSTPAERGAVLVQDNCARCHAVSAGVESPLPAAPSFVDVAKRYPPSALEEALAEGIVTGHPDMPEFVFEPDQIEAIVAYLDELAAQ